MNAWLRHRSFETRITSLVVAAVAVAIALVAIASYFAVSHQLYSQEDGDVTKDFSLVTAGGGGYSSTEAVRLLADGGVIVQGINASGGFVIAGLEGSITPTAAQIAVARSANSGAHQWSTVSVAGLDYRVLTKQVSLVSPGSPPQTIGLQIAAPLNTVEHALATLRVILLAVMLASIAVAIALGVAVARATLRPVKRLTAAAEHVAATQDLDAVIPAEADDELGRLAQAFNRMLSALGASRHQQAQLVSDAGHELRTPLTSLRTNVEFLTRAPTMPDADRTEVLRDINAQVEELTTLVGDLVELARQDETQPEPTEIRLDNLVARAVERARRRAPSLVFDVDLTAGSVRAQPPLLERAVLNVLDNATKWSPAGGTVSVRLRRHEHWTLEVRDHGPGIAAEDIPKVFDRFYRAETARAMPGSGLGLAIVNQVVRTHDGTVAIERPADGGTLVRIELPTVVEQEPGADTLARGLPPDAGDDGPPPAAAPPPALVRPPAPPPLAVPDRHGALRRALRSL